MCYKDMGGISTGNILPPRFLDCNSSHSLTVSRPALHSSISAACFVATRAKGSLAGSCCKAKTQMGEQICLLASLCRNVIHAYGLLSSSDGRVEFFWRATPQKRACSDEQGQHTVGLNRNMKEHNDHARIEVSIYARFRRRANQIDAISRRNLPWGATLSAASESGAQLKQRVKIAPRC